MENYSIENDLEVIKIIDKTELSPYTVTTYLSVLKQFSKCIGKPYSDIIHEIKELEGDEIVGNKIIRYNPNDSLINTYIRMYMDYLIKKNNKKSTVNLKIKQLITLLKKSNVETPTIKFKNEAKQSKVQLITTDDIRFVLNNSNIHHQALITFMASTGARRFDVVNEFVIEDFIHSVCDYINPVSVDEFLEQAPQDMIPYFEFIPNKTKKTGLPCKVCCSAEASNLIIQSLKLRKKSIERHNRENGTDLVLDETCPLFSSKRRNYIGKFEETSISVIFNEKNKLLKKHKEKQLDELFKNHKISRKEWKNRKENIPNFHPHSLRHRFISTLRAYTTNRDISLLMEGHASSISTDKYYVGESEELFNKESIKKTYLQVMPHLTFFQKVDPVSYLKEKNEVDKLQNKINILEEKIEEFEKMNQYFNENGILEKQGMR